MTDLATITMTGLTEDPWTSFAYTSSFYEGKGVVTGTTAERYHLEVRVYY